MLCRMATARKGAPGKKLAKLVLKDDVAIFHQLREVFAEMLPKLRARTDTETEYTLHTRVASPFKQHKGAPVFFSSVRRGKAYVSFHLFPLYMNPELTGTISPELKKRMQGKTCFNFKAEPEPATFVELKKLADAGLKIFETKGWA